MSTRAALPEQTHQKHNLRRVCRRPDHFPYWKIHAESDNASKTARRRRTVGYKYARNLTQGSRAAANKRDRPDSLFSE